MQQDLKVCLEKFRVLERLCIVTRERRKDANFLKRIDFPLLGAPGTERDVDIFFDNLQSHLNESAFVSLVATFERVVFQKLKNATGEMKKSLRENYEDSHPFHFVTDRFVKGDDVIDGLNRIREILTGKIPDDLDSGFGEVIGYRNRLAHGKRFGEETRLSLPEAAAILDEVLGRITNG